MSSFVRLDILSTYTENVEIRVLELEIFSGDGIIDFSNAVHNQCILKKNIVPYQRRDIHMPNLHHDKLQMSDVEYYRMATNYALI